MRLKIKDYLYVGLQLLLFVVFTFKIDLIPINQYKYVEIIAIIMVSVGFLVTLIALLQLNTNLSPFPSPKSSATLVITGMYKFSRHPIYTGILLMAFGYSVYSRSLYKIIVSCGLYILFYFKSNYEEERLELIFSEYKLYKQKTGRFFPKTLK